MKDREEYERDGWHFSKTGDQVLGWKNVILKGGDPGCVTISSDTLVVRKQSCADEIEQESCRSEHEFAQVMWDTLKTYYIGHQNDSVLIPQFLHEFLTTDSANEVGEDLNGILQSRLVT